MTIEIELSDKHMALLDALCSTADVTRNEMARDLIIAVLEDDAAAHGANPSPDHKFIVLQNYRGQK